MVEWGLCRDWCVPLTGEEVQAGALCVCMCGGGCQSQSWPGCETGEALALGAQSKEVPIASETSIF